MWATSKRPAACRTARCSSLTPLYQTGISHPAKGMILLVSHQAIFHLGSQAGLELGRQEISLQMT
jgi:hypothetical protein